MAAISITYAADGQHRITGRLLAYDQAAVLTFASLPAGANRVAVVSLAGGQTVLSTAGVVSGNAATISLHTTAVDELFRGQTRGPVAALLTVYDGAGRVMAAEIPLYASSRPGAPEPEELTGDYATIAEVAALIAAAGSGKPTTAKTTPIDADGVTLWDSTAGFAGKFLTWSALKTALGAVFAAVTHASTHASGGADPVTPAAIGAETAGAVSTHNAAAAAHPFTAADKYRYGGTDGATTEGTITAAGRALVAGETAAAQRGSLIAYRDQTPAAAAEVSGAAVAPDFDAALTLQWTLTGNVTSLATATHLADGETGEIIATIGAYALPADPPSGTYKGAWAVTGTQVRIIVEQVGAAQYWTADSLEVVA